MMIKNKKASHVGVILSFVIFVTFSIFVYTIIQPAIRIGSEKEGLLSYLKTVLNEEFSAMLTTASVNIEQTGNPQQPCVEFEDFLNDTEMKPANIIVKNEFEEIYMSNISSDKGLMVTREDPEFRFFRIYNSSEFNTVQESSASCHPLKKDKYSIGLIQTERQIFESRILRLLEEYGNYGGREYDNLKERLKFPLSSEFGFNFTYSNGTSVGTDEGEIRANVYSEEFPIRYVTPEASIDSGFITVRVW